MQLPMEKWRFCIGRGCGVDDDEALYCGESGACVRIGGIMNITQNLITPNKYSRPGVALLSVKKIAIHYVGNAGSTAAANRNYFEGLKVGKKNSSGNYIYASSHYIVGLLGEIIRCVPENEVSYCTNAANTYSIGIECCHPAADGKFNDKTNRALIELCADLCERYGLNPVNDMIRHYDVSGKMCPLYHVRNPDAWERLKAGVKAEMVRKGDDYLIEERVVSVNGKDVLMNVIMKDGRTFAEIRAFEKAGYAIGYNAAEKKAAISLSPEMKDVAVNGDLNEMEMLMVDGSNYVKLRELGKLGVLVSFDEERRIPVLSV